MKKHLALLLLPLLAACSNIRSKQPVGQNPVDLSAPADEIAWPGIAGDWLNAEGKITKVKILDAGKGRVEFRGSGKDDEPQTVLLRRKGDAFFVNFADDEGVYHWMMFKPNDDLSELVFWDPDRDKFRALIASGKIKGVNDPAEKKDATGKPVKNYTPGAVIDDASGAWVADMVAGKHGVLMDWKNPVVLRKKRAE